MRKFIEYIFTAKEMYIIRDALIEYYHSLADDSSIKKQTEVIKDAFKEDCTRMKE